MKNSKRVAVIVLTLCGSASSAPPISVPTCTAHDVRTPIRVWAPEFTSKNTLKSEPEASDGDIVFIEFNRSDDDVSCAGAKVDKLYSFTLPNNPNDPLGYGGLEVNLRGNVQFANGHCYFSGFFMNEQVMGMHQGWIATYFRPLDKLDIVMSSKFCISRASGAPAAK